MASFLLRNEAGEPYFRRVIENAARLVDHVQVVDDGSTDATVELAASIATAQGAVFSVVEAGIEHGDGEFPEVKLRKLQWRSIQKQAPLAVLVLDGDEEITPLREVSRASFRAWVEKMHDRAPNCELSARFFEMWDEDHYVTFPAATLRVGTFDPALVPEDRRGVEGLHNPRFPLVPQPSQSLFIQAWAVRHWGWSTEEKRKKKVAQRIQQDPANRAFYEYMLKTHKLEKFDAHRF